MGHITKLNKNDLAAIEHEVMLQMGPEPTLEGLLSEGYKEQKALTAVLDTISNTGRIITLIIAETIQSVAALAIGIVFAVLEFYRVMHGALALGQVESQAALIALAVVVANVVHPIYSLRELRGQSHATIIRQTGRGHVESFWRRLTGQPTVEKVDWSYNPVLHVAAAVITWATIALAVYDLLAPIMTSILTGTATKPGLILAVELLMGFALSLAGVFFLQAAAHEIGVRTLTDQPKRLTDVLEQRRAEYHAQQAAIRETVRNRYMAAALADQQRKDQQEPANPMQPVSVPAPIYSNGNGRSDHGPGAA